MCPSLSGVLAAAAGEVLLCNCCLLPAKSRDEDLTRQLLFPVTTAETPCDEDLHQQGGMSQLSHPSDKKTIPVVASSAELHMRTVSLIKVSAPDSITSSLATLCSFSAPGLIIPVSLSVCGY